MGILGDMPPISLPTADLKRFGDRWNANGGSLKRTPPESSLQFGNLFDSAVGEALAAMLGIEVEKPKANSLLPPEPDCVEVGTVRIVGGVRNQNFDVGYRPDGVRFAFDSKTLNDAKSIGKNYQNMINDLATEATTVHSRFPYAVVAFLVAVPQPCLADLQGEGLMATLDRLARRRAVIDPVHLAEAVALVVWDPDTGGITADIPPADSRLRIERFSEHVQAAYVERYKGLPPHIQKATPPANDEGEGAAVPGY